MSSDGRFVEPRTLRMIACAALALHMCGCKGPNPKPEPDPFARDMEAALSALESTPGPCEVCGKPSDSNQDRKTLVLSGQLIEFCCGACAEKFYADPNWQQYRKK